MILYTLIAFIVIWVPASWAWGAWHPAKVIFESVPFIDEEQDGYGWYCENDD